MSSVETSVGYSISPMRGNCSRTSGAVFVRRGLRKKIRESGAGYRSSAKRSLPRLTYTPQTSAMRFEGGTISPALFSGSR